MTLQSVMNTAEQPKVSEMATYKGYDVLTDSEGKKTLATPTGYFWLGSTLASAREQFAADLKNETSKDTGGSWLNPITWVSAVWNALGSMLGTILSCFGCGEKSENEGTEVGNG